MTIRTKILSTVIPLIVIPLLIIGLLSTSQAKMGITKVAQQLMSLKLEELYKKVSSVYDSLATVNLLNDKDMVQTSYDDIQNYCKTIKLLKGGYVQIVTGDGTVVLGTDRVGQSVKGTEYFKKFSTKETKWLQFSDQGQARVGVFLYFASWNWYLFISEASDSFYADAQQIQYTIVIIGVATIVLIIGILVPIMSTITKPAKQLVITMREIIKTHDLKKKAVVAYDDEIGRLTSSFNVMTDELDNAYDAVKNYAFDAILARDNEKRVRTVFQKYVPKEVVDQMLKIKEENASMLIGAKQFCTIFFSDIRDFTTISEALGPDELIKALNGYFTEMVSLVIGNRGIVDKFIGDAIMAVWGAPIVHPDDAVNGVKASFEMVKALAEFNKKMTEKGKINFKIGMGLSSGDVIAGNIGSEQKVDYTVIGDPVNTASRLEGLTKVYKVPIIISEYTWEEIKNTYPCRELDLIRVKGKLQPTAIYQPFETLDATTEKLQTFFSAGLAHYKAKEWELAIAQFSESYSLNQDGTSKMYIERCQQYKEDPPEDDWDGVYVFKTK